MMQGRKNRPVEKTVETVQNCGKHAICIFLPFSIFQEDQTKTVRSSKIVNKL